MTTPPQSADGLRGRLTAWRDGLAESDHDPVRGSYFADENEEVIRQIDILLAQSLPHTEGQSVEAAAKALFEHWIEEDFNNEYCSWEELPGKDVWRDRAVAALAATPTPTNTDVQEVVER